MRRVVVTGLGSVTPLGRSWPHTWNALLAGQCAVRPLELRHVGGSEEALAAVPTGVAEVPTDPGVSSNSREPPFVQFALAAAGEAWRQASLMQPDDAAAGRYGVAIGCGIGHVGDIADATQTFLAGGFSKLSPRLIPRLLPNMAAGHVSMALNLCGPCLAPATACAAGAQALVDAHRCVALGDADVMVAGGTEAAITPFALAGFARAKALSRRGAGRPFDADRDGFVMGEGAAALVLEEREHALARGATILAEFVGGSMSGDAHHMTSPHPAGRGAVQAMRGLVRMAEAWSARHSEGEVQVRYINAHATGTRGGDEVEAAAICGVFEAGLGPEVLLSSTKGATGHLLGAAGALEAAVCVQALIEGTAPPTVGLETPSDAVLEALEASRVRLVLAAPGSRPFPPLPDQENTGAMSNSFGFGGTNVSLLFVAAVRPSS